MDFNNGNPLRMTEQEDTRKIPKISPSKRAFEKCKPQGIFSEFYGISSSYFTIEETWSR